jgi:ParB family transcriptional regulator, chromosome partitioning protein
MKQQEQQWYGDSFRARLQSHSNEWYTPARYLVAVRQLLGTIDLDPASCQLANEVVQAAAYYDREANGLEKPWCGRVFLNPPYGKTGHLSNQEIWSCRLIAQYEAGITQEAVLLVNASTDTRWFQRLWQYPICFVDHRVNFYSVNGGCSGATHATVFVYFGPQEELFTTIFQQFGPIVRRISPTPLHLWGGSLASLQEEVSV